MSICAFADLMIYIIFLLLIPFSIYYPFFLWEKQCQHPNNTTHRFTWSFELEEPERERERAQLVY
jgi:hypothetical protein